MTLQQQYDSLLRRYKAAKGKPGSLMLLQRLQAANLALLAEVLK